MLKIDKHIFLHMQDELSREIYKKRVSYSNNNLNAIEKVISSVSKGGIQLIEFMNRHFDNLYIFGAGILGNEFLRTWMWKYTFRGFIDNDEKKWGRDIAGVPVIGLKDIEMRDRNKTAIIIVNKFSYEEIKEQLQQEKFICENIFNFAEYYLQLNRAQYFDLEALDKKQKERFVDCGALDGKTSMYMYEWYKGNVDKIWIFEPDKHSVEKCRQNLKKMNFQNYEIIEKAVYSSKQQLLFSSTGNGMAGINQNGNMVVDTVSLDEVIGEENPGFIKMDIEGAEIEALKGAEAIIRKNNPKLAVCVYHKPEDIETIPQLLLEYNPDYKFYLRHYSLTMNESVLYAL